LVLNRLATDHLEQLLARAEKHYAKPLPLDADARSALKAMADGDGRFILNLAEEVYALDSDHPLTTVELVRTVQKRAPIYDKGREGHYNLISALHKSVRGSDPDAALYWLARMLAGGEDPLYIARRVVRMAVEDIGLADPQAVVQTIAAKDAYDFLGSPEGELAIAQAVLYVALAPKSNAGYLAFGAAKEAADRTGSLNPPMHILNAPTRLMKDLGYGKGYVYDPDTPQGFSGQNYFPDDMLREHYYRPTEYGLEKEIKARLDRWAALRAKAAKK
jgi:putative ATPase